MQNNTDRREAFFQYQIHFKTNAFMIIDKMVKWCGRGRGTIRSRHLVDEILHSIFFLGKINTLPFSPEEIVGNLLNGLRQEYPRPFDFYETHLPRRSPFSCVLDMVVLQNQPENENGIRQILRDFVNTSLNGKFLVSTVICVSKSKNSDKQYGVSVSATGLVASRIMIAASCLSSYWDEYVAGAVMTYLPTGTRSDSFDGTFRLPKGVECKAYLVREDQIKLPCRSCVELFGLQSTAQHLNIYGNCAEAESLSNLFQKDEEIKRQSQPNSALHTAANRESARVDTIMCLNYNLGVVGFRWNNVYYQP